VEIHSIITIASIWTSEWPVRRVVGLERAPQVRASSQLYRFSTLVRLRALESWSCDSCQELQDSVLARPYRYQTFWFRWICDSVYVRPRSGTLRSSSGIEIIIKVGVAVSGPWPRFTR